MQVVKAALPFAVAMAIISAVTAILCTVRAELVGPQHLVFFYLLPTALVAVLYGRLPAMLCAIVATICAAYFLYAPLYSFSVAKPAGSGRIILFCRLGFDRR